MDIIKKTDLNGDIFYGYYDSDNGYFLLHNENGPAIIRADESKEWWFNELHNENGPAVIWRGSRYTDWYITGKNVTDEVEKWLDERNLDSDNLSEEDKLALSFYMRSL